MRNKSRDSMTIKTKLQNDFMIRVTLLINLLISINRD